MSLARDITTVGGGTLMGAMPSTAPDQIEAIALKQAKEKKLVEEAEMNSRNQAERMPHVVLHGGLPNRKGVRCQALLQRVSTEGAKHDRQRR